MFDRDEYESGNYQHFYLFRSSLAGVSYSLLVFPAVSAVEPSYGSIAGGQTVVISGSGFSKFPDELEVYVGGLPCAVKSSDVDRITCVTAPRFDDSHHADAYALYSSSAAITSARNAGSPGWWVKMWSDGANVNLESEVTWQFGWRQGFHFSMYDYYGNSWDTDLGFSTYNQRYTHDAGSIFTAPYAGHYTFYIATDDNGALYGSSKGIGIDETMLAYDYGASGTPRFFRNEKTQKSAPVPLAKGEKLFLRFRNVR
jgi:hypothetical protein